MAAALAGLASAAREATSKEYVLPTAPSTSDPCAVLPFGLLDERAPDIPGVDLARGEGGRRLGRLEVHDRDVLGRQPGLLEHTTR